MQRIQLSSIVPLRLIFFVFNEYTNYLCVNFPIISPYAPSRSIALRWNCSRRWSWYIWWHARLFLLKAYDFVRRMGIKPGRWLDNKNIYRNGTLQSIKPGKRPPIVFPQCFMALCSSEKKKYIINYEGVVGCSFLLLFLGPLRVRREQGEDWGVVRSA